MRIDLSLAPGYDLYIDGVLIEKLESDSPVVSNFSGCKSLKEVVLCDDNPLSVNMFAKVNVPILGIVENMSYYICPKCGNRDDIFGHAGARETSQRLGVKFRSIIQFAHMPMPASRLFLPTLTANMQKPI